MGFGHKKSVLAMIWFLVKQNGPGNVSALFVTQSHPDETSRGSAPYRMPRFSTHDFIPALPFPFTQRIGAVQGAHSPRAWGTGDAASCVATGLPKPFASGVPPFARLAPGPLRALNLSLNSARGGLGKSPGRIPITTFPTG